MKYTQCIQEWKGRISTFANLGRKEIVFGCPVLMLRGYRAGEGEPGVEVEPFWQQYGTLSTVDWCEPNYTWVPYVAEWWNTLSSLPMGVVGLLGWVACLLSKEKTPVRFHFTFLGLAAIGFGSTAFHGTLLRSSQALDELPMIGTSLVYLYCLAVRNAHTLPEPEAKRKSFLWATGLSLYVVAFTVAYFFSESYFVVFLVSYTVMVTYIVLRSFYVTFRPPRSALLERLGWFGLGIFSAGVFLLWIPEHVLLGCDHPIQAFHLHSGWHITSTIGGYCWGLWALMDVKRLRGEAFELEWNWYGLFIRSTDVSDAA